MLKKVRTHLSAKFAKFQLPDDCLLWDAIPETSTRKMDKKTVRKKLTDEGYRHPKVSEEDQKAMQSAFDEQKKLDDAADAEAGKLAAELDKPAGEVWDKFPVYKPVPARRQPADSVLATLKT